MILHDQMQQILYFKWYGLFPYTMSETSDASSLEKRGLLWKGSFSYHFSV